MNGIFQRVADYVSSLSLFDWAMWISGIAFVLLLFITLRSSEGITIPGLSGAAGKGRGLIGWLWAKIKKFFKDLLADIVFVFRQDEKAYSLPRILMLGSQGAGKTSIARSLMESTTLRSAGGLIESKLEEKGSWYFDKGVLIDFAELSALEGEDKAFASLIDERGERPVDGILVCLSAKEILEAGHRQLLDAGNQINVQIRKIQEQFNFTFPVYVLITKTDEITGFREFCTLCSDEELSQIMGWSNPGKLQTGYNDTVLDSVFTYLNTILLKNEFALAAQQRFNDIESPDSLILFPYALGGLKARLGKLLPKMFALEPSQTDIYFRGMYFSGLNPGSGVVGDDPTNSVVFINDLFEEKIFAEKHLAQVLKNNYLARQKSLRTIQYAWATLFVVWLCGIAYSFFRFDAQVNDIDSVLSLIENEQRKIVLDSDGCTDASVIRKLLADLGTLDPGFKSLAVPVSWLTGPGADEVIDEAGNLVFGDIVFPAFSCQLDRQFKQLIASPLPASDAASVVDDTQAFIADAEMFLKEVIRLHTIESTWNDFAAAGVNEAPRKLQKLQDLLTMLYGMPLPDSAQKNKSALVAILRDTRVSAYAGDPQNYAAVSNKISMLLGSLDSGLTGALEVGGNLLPELGSGDAGKADVDQFVSWVNWVDSNWLAGKPVAPLCEQLTVTLNDEFSDIAGFPEYPGNSTPSGAGFDAAYCANLLDEKIRPLSLPPLANLYEDVSTNAGDNMLVMTDSWKKEVGYLRALNLLSFMQLEPAGIFTCDAGASLWQVSSLQQAEKDVSAFSDFLLTTGQSLAPDLISAAGGLASAAQSAVSDVAAASDPSTGTPGAAVATEVAGQAANAAGDAVANAENSAADALELRPNVVVGQKNLIKAINSLLAGAQGNLPSPGGYAGSSGGSNQSLVKNASVEFSGSAKPLTSMFEKFPGLGLVTGTEDIGSCVQGFATTQLTSIKNLAQTTNLLQPQITPVSRVNSAQPLFVYGNRGDVSTWWDLEYARAVQVLDFSRPYINMLTLLSNVYQNAGQAGQQVQYWTSTLDALQSKNEFGRTDTQIDFLEGFYNTATDVTRSSCPDVLSEMTNAATGNGFFSARRTANQDTLRSFCNGEVTSTGQNVYSSLNDQFGRLGKKFPFAGKVTTELANLGDIRSFFINYAASRDALENYLAAITVADPVQQKEDIGLFQGAMQYFNSHLPIQNPETRLNFAVTFRVADPATPDQSTDSSGAQNVTSWSMSNGIEGVYRPARPNMSLSWYYGEALNVSFTWPPSISPQPDPSQPNLKIDTAANTSRFVFDSQFALQEMIAGHVRSGPLPGTSSPEPVVLRFRVPVKYTDDAGQANKGASAGQADDPDIVELFVKLAVSTTNENGQQVPVFLPTKLPDTFPADK